MKSNDLAFSSSRKLIKNDKLLVDYSNKRPGQCNHLGFWIALKSWYAVVLEKSKMSGNQSSWWPSWNWNPSENRPSSSRPLIYKETFVVSLVSWACSGSEEVKNVKSLWHIDSRHFSETTSHAVEKDFKMSQPIRSHGNHLWFWIASKGNYILRPTWGTLLESSVTSHASALEKKSKMSWSIRGQSGHL